MISTIIMIIIISSSSNSGIIFSFYGFVKLLLMQSLHSCFPRAATGFESLTIENTAHGTK